MEVSYFVHLLSNLEEYRYNIKAKTLPIYKGSLKFGESRRNIQKIYDAVRKELQDECHCARSLLKVTRTCPIWQSEKIVEKLIESLIVPCEVLLVWKHSISRQG